MLYSAFLFSRIQKKLKIKNRKIIWLSFSCFAFRVSGWFQKHYMVHFKNCHTVDAFCLLKTKLILHLLLCATATATELFAPSIALLAVFYSVVIRLFYMFIYLGVFLFRGILFLCANSLLPIKKLLAILKFTSTYELAQLQVLKTLLGFSNRCLL